MIDKLRLTQGARPSASNLRCVRGSAYFRPPFSAPPALRYPSRRAPARKGYGLTDIAVCRAATPETRATFPTIVLVEADEAFA